MNLEPRLITLSKNEDSSRGNLTYIEKDKHIPFNIERTSWIYNVPGDKKLDGNAFKNQQDFIIPLSGSLDIAVDNGYDKKIYSLNAANKGLYVPPNFWRQMQNFSTNCLVLVLSSTKYAKEDYIWDYEEYLKKIKNI